MGASHSKHIELLYLQSLQKNPWMGPPGFLGGFPLNPGPPAREAGIIPLDYGPSSPLIERIFKVF
jgi:hypothetical protein